VLDRRLVGREVAAQGFENAPIVHRVDVAADDRCQRTHPGPLERIGRQQRRCRIALLEPLDDGRRLGQHLATDVQRRHQLLRVDGPVGRIEVLFLAQIDGHLVVVQALEIQRDTQAVRGAAAKESVERWSV
jgi:hypothetical protein